MSDQQLMNHLGFDESELQANRNGRISEKQKARLQIKETGSKTGALILGLVCLVSALIGLGVGTLAAIKGEEIVFKFVFSFVFGCIWPLIWGAVGVFSLRRAFAKMEVKVQKAEGPINIVRVTRRSYNSGMKTFSDYSAYELRVGGRTIDVRSELSNIMMQGDVYAVYYAEFNLTDKKKEVLSAELLTKGSGAFAPKPISMDYVDVAEYLRKGDMLGAIRMHRSIHGSNLEDAKAAVEEIRARIER